MKILPSLLFVPLLVICCGPDPDQRASSSLPEPFDATRASGAPGNSGSTILSRFAPPEGFERKDVDSASFAAYLRHLPLKPPGSKVRYYNGEIKSNDVYVAVVDMDIGKKDLQHCADAVMRLKGEYLYGRKAYDEISFTLTNGFKLDYSEYMNGNRLVVTGNKTSWKKSAAPSNTYEDFRKYMEVVFTYAGTLSLSKSLHPRDMKALSIGDVFIQGGSPGHAVVVVDVAENVKGEKVFMLAQSYMPAQETQILKNFSEPEISPWYRCNNADDLDTPEWRFKPGQLKTW